MQYNDENIAPEVQVTYLYNDKNVHTFIFRKCGCSYRYSDKNIVFQVQLSYHYNDKKMHTFLFCKVWDIPAIQARAGADIPRDFPRAQPEGNPEEYLHLPELGWQE